MKINSPMTASVWRILVTAGDSVAAGQSLLILESMKMEIPVEAPIAGTVQEIHVEEEEQVAQNALLMTLSEA